MRKRWYNWMDTPEDQFDYLAGAGGRGNTIMVYLLVLFVVVLLVT